MTARASQLWFDFAGEGSDEAAAGTRRETRASVVRQVEYGPFPRQRPCQRRMGLTRDLSESGLCLRADAGRPVGSLLRVVLHSVDGRPAVESVGRVAWCERSGDGAWIGLQLVSSRKR